MKPTIKPYGKNSLLVEYDKIIDPIINDRIIGLEKILTDHYSKIITYFIPAYSSLTIGFRPEQLSYDDFKSEILELTKRIDDISIIKNCRKFKLPACYDISFGLDLNELSTKLKLSKEEIIYHHTNQEYRVYMIGFLPGFPYMGKTHPKLKCTRLEVPRAKVNSGSIGIAGEQTGIYPSTAPGGWNIIGRCPIPLFRYGSSDPFILNAGDLVTFESVNLDRYNEIYESANFDSFDFSTLII